MEAEIFKYICANKGAVDAEELMCNLCPDGSVNEVITNQEKFVLFSVNTRQKVVARTGLRLCWKKDCPGPCGGLHLCKNFLFSGVCHFVQRRICRFSHDLNSDHNQRLLAEHELEGLDRVELCTLLLQSQNTLLPSICHDYNNGDGEFGRCQSGIACARLHICERYLNRDCSCSRNHDFYAPQPLKTLYDKGVPDNIISTLKSVYANKMALRFSGNRNSATVNSSDAESDEGLNVDQRPWYRGRGGIRGHRGYRGNGANFQPPLHQQRTSSFSDVHAYVGPLDLSHDRLNDGVIWWRYPNSSNTDSSSFGTGASGSGGRNKHWNQPSNLRGRSGSNHQRLPRTRSTNDISAANGAEQRDRQQPRPFKDPCFKTHNKMPYRGQVKDRGQGTDLNENETTEDYCDSKKTSRMELEESRYGVEEPTQTVNEDESEKATEAASEVEHLKSQVRMLLKDLEQAQSKLDETEGMKKKLWDRCQEVEQEVATLRAQLVEKQVVWSEKEQLNPQMKADDERNNLAQLKDAYTKLFEDYNKLKEEKKKGESLLVDDLQQRLTAAEEALAVKQSKIDEMKQEMFLKEKELETISVLQAQADVYSSDFYAERAMREKLHTEKEHLATQLEYVKKQNQQLQKEVDCLGRRSLSEMQQRHGTSRGHPLGEGAGLSEGGMDQQHQNIPEHTCPKCNESLPDLDSLIIHTIDCIN